MAWNSDLKSLDYADKDSPSLSSIHSDIVNSGTLSAGCKSDFDGCNYDDGDNILHVLFKTSEPSGADTTEIDSIVSGY